ncbi:nitrogenase iron protein [Acidaminobacter sp. JC074]|uniref:nucleotide-binding protein n=1 Tax=Acidaminobacter sp. JC074 TaxID=2530199 RepID=UPI001F10B286|nr:nitrogenase iron protein NifH [Acidaminobacter sp. JC074]MCH4891043.1 nitrogenase iron protein [Acidaminobacter sp. JC074]
MKKIAIYGKGGIGKSTTTSNLAAALSIKGYKVVQIGCDPKADSTKNLNKGQVIPTILDRLKEDEDLELEDLVTNGFNDIKCFESGGPTPGVGCAGRGIITAFEKLDELEMFDEYQPDIVIYDVLGDVVCGGFAMPIRNGYAEEVYVVTSGEMMSLYAASNITTAVNQFKSRGYAKLGGMILNAKGIENEVELVQKVSEEIDHPVIHYIPRKQIVQDAEHQGKTVVEAFPQSDMAKVYFELAEKIMA